MSDLNVVELEKNTHETLRVAAALSFGTLALPYADEVTWPAVRARRVPALAEWILERETFQTQIVEGYSTMATNEVRQLVAGTGVGKSTTLPYLISSTFGVCGLILMPNNALPVMNLKYLRKKFAELGGNSRAEILRTSHAEHPIPAPCVYLTSAADFLGRLAKRPALLTDLGVEFIYLDESHETRPDYTVFRYIKHVGLLGDVKVFFGTATAAADINMEDGGVGRRVQAKPLSMFPVSSPNTIPATSPMHYSNIQDRTLIFVANDEEANALALYYDQHDIPVLMQLMSDGSRRLHDIEPFLAENTLCALLVHASFQTGFTFNLDTVIDCGYSSELQCNFQDNSVSVVKRPVSQAERVQRMGRVGRFKPGRGYYADVEVSPPISEYAPERALYIYLWCRVFNIAMNEPAIAEFGELTGDITPLASAILLHSRVHPYLMLPYVANDGFYDKWAKSLRFTLYSSVKLESTDSNGDKVQRWPELTTGAVDWSPTPVKYRCAVKFPKQWAVIPAFAWLVYNQFTDVHSRLGLSTRSVISGVSTLSPPQRRSQRVSFVSNPRNSVSSVSQSEVSDSTVTELPPAYASRQTVVDPTVELDVPSVRQLQNAFSLVSVPPALADIVPTMPRSASQQSVAQVEQWRNQVDPAVRTHTRRVSSSESSTERENIQLKQVDPKKYRYFKLYPMDTSLCQEFMQNEAVTRDDYKRVNNLLSGKRDFSSLSDDRELRHGAQHVYFTAVLRVHNSALSRKLQINANVRPGFAQRLMGSLSNELQAEETRILSTVRLLEACALQHYYVGVDVRSIHISESSAIVTPVYTEYEAHAKIMMALGDPDVVSIVYGMQLAFRPVMEQGMVVSNAWQIGRSIVTTMHSCIETDTSTWPEGATSCAGVFPEHDLMVFASDNVSSGTVIRHAKDSESVYVLFYSQLSGKVTVAGDFNLRGRGDPYVMDFLLTHGCSGALVLSVDDGAILGMYRGEYTSMEAWVIPLVHIKDSIVY